MKAVTIQVSSKFKRSFNKLPINIREEALIKKEIFQKNPLNPLLRTHKLKGKLSDQWSFSVTRSFRITFTFKPDNNVLFNDIGDHRIYQ